MIKFEDANPGHSIRIAVEFHFICFVRHRFVGCLVIAVNPSLPYSNANLCRFLSVSVSNTTTRYLYKYSLILLHLCACKNNRIKILERQMRTISQGVLRHEFKTIQRAVEAGRSGISNLSRRVHLADTEGS